MLDACHGIWTAAARAVSQPSQSVVHQLGEAKSHLDLLIEISCILRP